MRRNRRNNVKKERIIMIASSAFVLSALTMTGIYMKSNNADEKDDGYMLDFTALEEDIQDKTQEIAQNGHSGTEQSGNDLINNAEQQIGSLEDDLDYMPMEAGSGLVTIPGLTDGLLEDDTVGEEVLGAEELPVEEEAHLPAGESEIAGEANLQENTAAETELSGAAQAPGVSADNETSGESDPAGEESNEGHEGTEASDSGPVEETMHFSESEGLLRPVSGEVLIPFSMDGSVYFSTLDQFKYNPAMMIAAEEGSSVAACAEGVVIDIFQDSEIGHAITMDLGDGYRLTYGQLNDINVTVNSHVEPGEIIASVAAPTKYYSVEGSNLYLKMTANGTPVNPETLFYQNN